MSKLELKGGIVEMIAQVNDKATLEGTCQELVRMGSREKSVVLPP